MPEGRPMKRVRSAKGPEINRPCGDLTTTWRNVSRKNSKNDLVEWTTRGELQNPKIINLDIVKARLPYQDITLPIS